MLNATTDSREGTHMKRLTTIGLVVAVGVAGIAIGVVAAVAIPGPRLAAFPRVPTNQIEVIPPRGMFGSDHMYRMDQFDFDPDEFGYFDRMPRVLHVSPLAAAGRGVGLWQALSVIGAVTGISALVLTLARRPRPAAAEPAATPDEPPAGPAQAV